MPRKVTGPFSSREEVGSQGAQTAAFRLQPDACIAVDVTFATQPGVSDKEGGKLGGGPMVGLSPVLSRRMAQKKSFQQNANKFPFRPKQWKAVPVPLIRF